MKRIVFGLWVSMLVAACGSGSAPSPSPAAPAALPAGDPAVEKLVKRVAACKWDDASAAFDGDCPALAAWRTYEEALEGEDATARTTAALVRLVRDADAGVRTAAASLLTSVSTPALELVVLDALAAETDPRAALGLRQAANHLDLDDATVAARFLAVVGAMKDAAAREQLVGHLADARACPACLDDVIAQAAAGSEGALASLPLKTRPDACPVGIAAIAAKREGAADVFRTLSENGVCADKLDDLLGVLDKQAAAQAEDLREKGNSVDGAVLDSMPRFWQRADLTAAQKARLVKTMRAVASNTSQGANCQRALAVLVAQDADGRKFASSLNRPICAQAVTTALKEHASR